MRLSARLSWIPPWLTLFATLGCDVPVQMGGDQLFSSDSAAVLEPSDTDAVWAQVCPSHYEVVSLGTLGGEIAYARGISDRGWVVGHSAFELGSDTTRPYIWIPTEDNGRVGTMNALAADLGIGFTPLDLFAVNDRGEAVGYGALDDPSGFGGQSAAGFYWSQEDGIILLEGTGASGINNLGQVVGTEQTAQHDRTYEASYIWSKIDGYRWLPSVAGAPEQAGAAVIDINDAGVVAGIAFDGGYRGHAVKYTVDFGYSKLPDFGSSRSIGAWAGAINNNGQIVGVAVTALDDADAGFGRPVLWDADGSLLDLGLVTDPPGIVSGEAFDINDDGIIVGADENRAWIWCAGVKQPLDDVIVSDDDWELTWATGINSAGQIVAGGTHNGTPGLQGLLFPVYEEPETD